METFSALLAICEGNSPVAGEFPTQKPVTQSFDVFFDLRLNKRFNGEATDLRRHRAHYDVAVMFSNGNNALCHVNFPTRHNIRQNKLYQFIYCRLNNMQHKQKD